MSHKNKVPLWLLAELSYACPLQCPYCSNPTDFALRKQELTTEEWLRVFQEARELGSVQLGFSGGEPMARKDLEELVRGASQLGFYTNLITSAVGLDEKRLCALKEAGLDHIQISFQASSKDANDYLAGTKAYDHKIKMANLLKSYGFQFVLNIVLHRNNIDDIDAILDMAMDLQADYVELANAQYYGFALHNRDLLLPTKTQVEKAEKIANQYQEKYKNKSKIYYVVPDYYEKRPKPCMNGWASTFLSITPDGYALPCQSARALPNLEFPSVKEHSLKWIWEESSLFNKFRGYEWMKEPCRSCPEKEKDFGGCRCQAFLLTGDAENTDPVCELSPLHGIIQSAIESANQKTDKVLVFRNPKNSKRISKQSSLEIENSKN